MNKNANADILRQALMGLLMGGGAYGGLRLGRDMMSASQKPQKPDNQLDLMLPEARIPKTANDIQHSPLDLLGSILGYGGGAGAGFLGASKLYDMYRQKQITDQQKGVEEDYMNTLQQAHHKSAELQTPLVDKFLEGIITKVGELQKEAVYIPSEGIGEMFKHQAGNAGNWAAHTELGSDAIAAWIAGTLGTGALTFGVANNMDKNKQKAQAKTNYPTDVNLSVAK